MSDSAFIKRTNEDYAAWCRTFYVPESLDERGMKSLDGLWAWQQQERRKAAGQKPVFVVDHVGSSYGEGLQHTTVLVGHSANLGALEKGTQLCKLADGQPKLTVVLRSFPESNGKRNWTAQFVRVDPWGGLIGSAGGITISHGEFWNRVAYEAERARFLLGERDTEPFILDYGDDIQTPEEWKGEVHGGRPARAVKG